MSFGRVVVGEENFFEENGPLQLSCMEDGSGLKMRGCTKITLSNFGAGVHFCYLPVAQ